MAVHIFRKHMFRDFWYPSPFINSFCTINNHILGNFWPLSPQGAYIICRRPLIYINPKAETDSLHIFILGTIFYVTIVIHRISLVVQNLDCLHCLIMEPYIVVLVRSIWICKIHRCFPLVMDGLLVALSLDHLQKKW